MIPWCRDDAERALDEIDAVSGTIIARFTVLLNAFHRTTCTSEYWDLIGGEWLLHFSHVVYAAYREVFAGTESCKAEEILPLFADHHEFLGAAVGNASLAETLRRHVQSFLDGPGICRWSYSSKTKVIGKRAGSFSARFKAATKEAVFSGLSSRRSPFVFCNPYVVNGRGEWLSALWRWRRWARQDDFNYPVYATASVDATWRWERAAEISGTSYGDTVLALMPLYLPVAYLEGYAEYRRQAQALALPRPRVLYTANSLHGHTLFKVLAADWRAEGTRILDHQHGGGYGIDRVHTLEDYETRVADRFYTLGWSGSKKQVPLPRMAIRISRSRESLTKRILLVCVNFPNNVYRIHFHPMPGTVETMVAQTVNFVERVRGCSDLAIRPYPLDYGRNFLAQLQQTGTMFEVDASGRAGPESYAHSALVVHNYLGTSWIETLAMNIPTVCFYDIDTYAFRTSVQPFIDRLTAVGILHNSAATAAAHVRSVACDAQGWWQSTDVQSARDAFIERYGNFSPQWAVLWEDEFRRWIE